MKQLIVLIALSSLAACASKTSTPSPTMATTTETAAPKAAETSTPETKKAVPSAKKAPAKKESTTATSAVGAAEMNCKSGSDERKLAIQVKEAGCELQYVKAGESKVIASQIKGSEKCEEVMTSVKEKLVAANFSCQ